MFWVINPAVLRDPAATGRDTFFSIEVQKFEMKSGRWLSLSRKMNILIIGIILALSAGLVYASYHIYSDKIIDIYLNQGEMALRISTEWLTPDLIENFRSQIMSDEFRDIRDKAIAANDENIIREWMHTRPSIYGNNLPPDTQNKPNAAVTAEQTDLYTDYEYIISLLQETSYLFDTRVTYVKYPEQNSVINIADPEMDLFSLAAVDEYISIDQLTSEGNYEPGTIYLSESGWLLSAYIELDKTEDGTIPGYVGIEIDMNTVVQNQRMFLINSAVYVISFTVITILISMFLMNRTVVSPLQKLTRAAQNFAKDDRELTPDDVIQLPIRSNDEIGDLYNQMRSMQTRILDHIEYMNHITAEKERSGTELRMAYNIQQSMLPGVFPAFPDRPEFDLYASMTPAREVGGDFYDFFMVDEDHLAVLIADVSDKGVPAALFMMSTMILISYRARQGGTPAEILTAVNAHICRSNSSKMFVTVWMGILDLKTGVMTCSNAGHEYPFIRGANGHFSLFRDKHGLVVGALPKTKYQDYELKLEPDNAVFVYTDGVPEACCAEEEFYGMERLEKTLNRTTGMTPKEIIEAVKSDVDAFVDDAKQFDDLTMLCIEYKGVLKHDENRSEG